MDTPFQHPTLSRLREYSLGTLPEEQQNLAEQHLLICSVCRDTVEQLEQLRIEQTEQARKNSLN